MLSGKLVELIEGHWEEIAARVIRVLRTNPDTPVLGARAAGDLKEWCRLIVARLGDLLLADEVELRQRAASMGRTRYEESVPLHEAVLRFQILHEKIIGLVHEQFFESTALELYAEEELELRISRCFGAMVYGLVRGYEEAMRGATRGAGW